MFVYNGATGHVTWSRPPDWLPPYSCILQPRGIVQFPGFPPHGCRSFVSTFFSVFILLRKYGVSHLLCQSIDERSKSHLDKCFADLMGHQTERIGDQVKLPFGDSWFSRMDHLICVVAIQCKVHVFNLIFLYYRRDYIQLGSKQDPTWRDFPAMLTETGVTRRYVTLYEAPFQASQLSDAENNALRAGSLMAIPLPPPEFQPLAGSTVATYWASTCHGGHPRCKRSPRI